MTTPCFPPRRVQRREQAHRRTILLGIGALIVLSTSPVFGHHLLEGSVSLFGGRDHIAGICLIALHELLAPVHFGFHVVLALGLAYATFDRVRAAHVARTALGALDARPPAPGSAIAAAASAAALPLDRILVVPGLPNPVFTIGWWRPRVYVADEVTDVLNAEQLAAVLAHEGAHVARRDPLRLSVLRFLACTLFYLPSFRRLADDAADEAEIVADDAAVRGRPLVLAESLLLLATAWGRHTWPGATITPVLVGAGAVGFPTVGLIDRRVRRLAGEDVPIRTHVTLRSLLGAAGLLLAMSLSGLIMAHPLAAEGASPHGHASALPAAKSATGPSHCHEHEELAVAHLFCLGFHQHAQGSPCPHRGMAR